MILLVGIVVKSVGAFLPTDKFLAIRVDVRIVVERVKLYEVRGGEEE